MQKLPLDIDDLLLDPGFRNWAMNIPDDESRFWCLLEEEHTDFRLKMAEAKALVLAAESNTEVISSDENREMLQSLKARMGWEADQQEATRVFRLAPVYKVAAVVAVLIASGWFAFHFFTTNASENTLAEAAVEYVEKKTPRGAKLSFYLEDGTRVILNAESKVRFSHTYATDQKRLLELEGEAYFEVAKDPNRPFLVKTGSLTTRALGTIFTINARPENEKINVALVEGSVLVNNQASHAEVILKPGQMINTTVSDKELKPEGFSIEEHIAWKDGTIYFDQLPFEESIAILERWYGVDITVQNKPGIKLSCSGNFTNDNLSNVLNSLGFALNFDYTIDNKKVTVTFKK